ncbi:unnamed protein product [Chironomus riparius]|uniref:Uncharacterized protein n=1 Tax=Chironomus riparius TaxID=315576 RepID=A0A9N9RSQ6_9DIPT|nr:unnamed protein product [Chironomus riparius]
MAVTQKVYSTKMSKMNADEFQKLRKKAAKPTWTGWRYAALIGGLVGAVTLTLYPIAIEPIMNPQKYKDIQKKTRASVNQEQVQPGNMRVWSDPFKPLPNKYDKEDE